MGLIQNMTLWQCNGLCPIVSQEDSHELETAPLSFYYKFYGEGKHCENTCTHLQNILICVQTTTRLLSQ